MTRGQFDRLDKRRGYPVIYLDCYSDAPMKRGRMRRRVLDHDPGWLIRFETGQEHFIPDHDWRGIAGLDLDFTRGG